MKPDLQDIEKFILEQKDYIIKVINSRIPEDRKKHILTLARGQLAYYLKLEGNLRVHNFHELQVVRFNQIYVAAYDLFKKMPTGSHLKSFHAREEVEKLEKVIVDIKFDSEQRF